MPLDTLDPKVKPYYGQLQANSTPEQVAARARLALAENGDPHFELQYQAQESYSEHWPEAKVESDNISRAPANSFYNTDNSKKHWEKQGYQIEHGSTYKQSRNINKLSWTKNALPKMEDKFQGLKEGDVGRYGTTYCPWHMVYKYPTHWVGKATRAKIEKHFQRSDIFACWNWDFFYTYIPKNKEAIILVLTTQFVDFLSDLNRRYDLQMAIPNGKIRESFAFRLGSGSFPPARYLGRATNEKQFDELCEGVPAKLPEDYIKEELAHQKIDLLRKANSMRNGADRNKKKGGMRAPERRKGWGQMTKRVQRYLGLRKKEPVKGWTLQGDALRKMKAESRVEVDVNKAVPFDMEDSMVFLCFDLEMYERNPNVVTEVGIAILDTKDIKDMPPGENGENWFMSIKARHIRIQENMGYRNFQFVQGWPDRFNFGESELVPMAEVKNVLKQVLEAHAPMRPDSSKFGNVVIVGHDLKGDVEGLKKVGFNLYDIRNIREMVDTKDMFQHLMKMQDGRKLKSILDAFELHNAYLHNAGNDAVYAMQAMIAVALSKRLKTLNLLHGRDVDFGVPGEGWSSDEMDDGGLHPPLIDPNSYKPKPVSKVDENPQAVWDTLSSDDEQDGGCIINAAW